MHCRLVGAGTATSKLRVGLHRLFTPFSVAHTLAVWVVSVRLVRVYGFSFTSMRLSSSSSMQISQLVAVPFSVQANVAVVAVVAVVSYPQPSFFSFYI